MAGIDPKAVGADHWKSGREIVRAFSISATSAAFTSTTRVFGPAQKRYAVVQVGPLRAGAFQTDGVLTSRFIRASPGESANVSGVTVTGALTVTSATGASGSGSAQGENSPAYSVDGTANILEVGQALYHRITSAVSVSGLVDCGGEVRLFELPG
jgi:hypothetical protein